MWMKGLLLHPTLLGPKALTTHLTGIILSLTLFLSRDRTRGPPKGLRCLIRWMVLEAPGQKSEPQHKECHSSTHSTGSQRIQGLSSVQFSRSVVSDSLRLHGFPVHHQLPEPAQTHVHWVSDAIQPSHPLSSPSPPVFNLSQHQGLFQWVTSSHQGAKVLELQLQHHSFQWILWADFL